MEQNKSAEEFIAGLLANSPRKINFLTDLESLVVSAFENHKVEELHEAAFTAKYIAGLKRVMQAGAGNPEVHNMADIQADVMKSFEKLIAILQSLQGDSQFAGKFIERTDEAFANLNGLIDDLAQVKVYFNLLRRITES